LAEVRSQLTPICSAPPKGQLRTVEDARKQAAKAWLGQRLEAKKPLLVSDENLIGSCERIFALRTLYPSALPRLQRLAEVLAGHEVRIWLAVREYAGFLRSAYCETLRHGPYRPFRQAYTGLAVPERGWEHLAKDVRQAFPKAELRCWRYESLQALRAPITSTLFGLAPEALPAPDERRDRRSLSRMAVRVLDDIFEHVGADDATRVRASVERTVSGGGMPAFDPWEEAEREHFSAAYERSIAALQAMPGVTWLG
jgi:hypothetical protein